MLAPKLMIAKNSKFAKRRNQLFKSVIVSGVFALVFVLVIGFFIFQNVKMGKKRTELEGKLQELQTQMNELSTQREKLEANVAEMQTEEYQEKVLREQGLYKKEGEQVVTVLPPEVTAETAPVEEEKERVWWNPFTW